MGMFWEAAEAHFEGKIQELEKKNAALEAKAKAWERLARAWEGYYNDRTSDSSEIRRGVQLTLDIARSDLKQMGVAL